MKTTKYEGNQTFTVFENELVQPAKGEVRIKYSKRRKNN